MYSYLPIIWSDGWLLYWLISPNNYYILYKVNTQSTILCFHAPGICSGIWTMCHLISYYQCLLLFYWNCYVIKYKITL